MGASREESIQLLYAAAMGTGAWTDALDAMAGLAHSQVVTLDTYDLETHAGQVIAANVVPDPAIEDYNREFGRGNFQIEAGAPHYRIGKVLRTSDFISQRELLRSDLYHHVYHPMGIRYGCGAAMEVTDQKIVEFTFMKAIDAGDHTDGDIHRVRALVPHLQQAWAGYSHLMELQDSLNILTSMWDCFAHAVFVIDERMRIRFANRAAEARLANGSEWSDRFGRLHRTPSARRAILEQAVKRVLDRQGDVISLAGTMPPDACKTAVTLYRLSENRIALIITDPKTVTGDLQPALRMRFDLTATEAELVDALIAGKALRTIADEREIRYETARAHLKNAMRKNGWRRQGEMISDVLRVLLPAASIGA